MQHSVMPRRGRYCAWAAPWAEVERANADQAVKPASVLDASGGLVKGTSQVPPPLIPDRGVGVPEGLRAWAIRADDLRVVSHHPGVPTENSPPAVLRGTA